MLVSELVPDHENSLIPPSETGVTPHGVCASPAGNRWLNSAAPSDAMMDHSAAPSDAMMEHSPSPS